MINEVKYDDIDFLEHIKSESIHIYEEDNKIVGFILFYDHITWGLYRNSLCR
jgi:hypothetical protein